MDCSMPGFPVHQQLLELTQTHAHWVGDAIQSSHPLSSPFLTTFNLSQYQGLLQWVSSSHTVVYNNFDSKCDFAPPTILLRLLLCSWTWVSFLVGSNFLLSMVVQQSVVILEFLQKLSSISNGKAVDFSTNGTGTIRYLYEIKWTLIHTSYHT